MAVTCLQISAVLGAVLGWLCLAALLIPSLRSRIDVVLTGVCVVPVVVIELIVLGVRRRRFGAWVVALGLFAVCAELKCSEREPTVFLGGPSARRLDAADRGP